WSKDYVYAGDRLVAVVQDVQPFEPAGITSSASSSSVHLGWVANTEPDLYGYNVYRSTDPNSGFTRLDPNSTILNTSFDDLQPLTSASGLVPAYYVVTAVDTAGAESRFSTPRLIT